MLFFVLFQEFLGFLLLPLFCGVILARYTDSSFTFLSLTRVTKLTFWLIYFPRLISEYVCFSVSVRDQIIFISRVNNQDGYCVCGVLIVMSLGRKNGKTTTIMPG